MTQESNKPVEMLAVTHEDRVPPADDNIGPIYRKRKPTVSDYDEVIADLQAARDDLARSDWSQGCSVCGDSGCASDICHHNALVAARAWVREQGRYRCYHCGFVAETDEQAREHFGNSEDEVAKCLRDRIRLSSTPAADRNAALEEADIERVAAAIYDAPDSQSGDTIGTVIWNSEHLFYETVEGEEIVDTARRASMPVCRDAARAVIRALASTPSTEARRAETQSGSVHESAVPKGCAQPSPGDQS
jgi:hypothetical protein